ncbi:MAG TPA: tetratricopeptide repeat protein [Bacteroidia bacterium]|nr:tetratricopeptide repeat protein [Bacteroidia bacterium]
MVVIPVVLTATRSPLLAQPNQEQYKKAVELKAHRQFSEALVIFKDLLHSDSSNATYLYNTAFLMARQGIHQTTSEKRMQTYARARYLAEKAIRISPGSAEAHFSLAFALGRQSEEGSNSMKINNAKIIRVEAEKAIALDPTLPGPYHILGMWHQVVAGFNGFEKAMIATFFGSGLEGGTYQESIYYFNKAISLEPDNVNHYYQLGITYMERGKTGDSERARTMFKKVTGMKMVPKDDQPIVDLAKKRLKELN